MGYEEKKAQLGLAYGILDSPTWFGALFYGLQHFLASFAGILSTPLIIISLLCLDNNTYGYVIQSKIVSSMFFAAGVGTVLQTALGSRLPILEGASFTFVTPAIALLTSSNYKCEVPASSEAEEEVWQSRMQILQGGLIIASLVQVLIGACGLVGFLLRFVGPMTIAPVLIQIGISLTMPAVDYCKGNWAVAIIVMFVLILCMEVLARFSIPFPGFNFKEKKCTTSPLYCFRLFPILIGTVVGIIVCVIFTVTDTFPEDDASRTDNDRAAMGIAEAPWIFFPYPCQWGLPQFVASAIIGMISGALASIIESIGGYFAAARMVAAPPVPSDGVNRGILMEGFACLWAGLIGSGCGVTSYSGNIGALAITRNGSPRIMYAATLVLCIFGLSPKIAACLLWIPEPIIGGIFTIACSLPVSVGVQTLQFCNMNNSRNLFVLGFSIFFGLMIEKWIQFYDRTDGAQPFDTGIPDIDELLEVLLSTSMFTSGILGCFFDNVLPGSIEDRGIIAWREEPEDDGSLDEMVNDVYLHPFVRGHRYWKWMPFMPNARAGVKIDKVGTEKDLELMEDEKEAVAEVEAAVEKDEEEKTEVGESTQNI